MKKIFLNVFLVILLLSPTISFSGIELDGTDDRIDCGTGDILTENGAMAVYAKFRTGSSIVNISRFFHRGTVLSYFTSSDGTIVFAVDGDTELTAQSATIL